MVNYTITLTLMRIKSQRDNHKGCKEADSYHVTDASALPPLIPYRAWPELALVFDSSSPLLASLRGILAVSLFACLLCFAPFGVLVVVVTFQLIGP